MKVILGFRFFCFVLRVQVLGITNWYCQLVMKSRSFNRLFTRSVLPLLRFFRTTVVQSCEEFNSDKAGNRHICFFFVRRESVFFLLLGITISYFEIVMKSRSSNRLFTRSVPPVLRFLRTPVRYLFIMIQAGTNINYLNFRLISISYNNSNGAKRFDLLWKLTKNYLQNSEYCLIFRYNMV